jgi:3-oxoacyl-[acyl-carrier protein] reductase
MRVLITGGRSDIAQSMTKMLNSQGHQVFVTASNAESASEVQEIYKKKATTLLFNLRNYAEPNTEFSEELNKGFDILILNAATKVKKLKLFHHFTMDEINKNIQSNIQGNVWLIQQLLPSMIEKKFGRILFISSIAANTGTSRYGAYCLTKNALEGLMLNLAVDYAKHGIYSNILRPGVIKTERTKRFWSKESYIEKVTNFIPAKKLGEAHHIAKAAMPMIDEDSYLNGAVLNVGGGLPLIKSEGVFS